MGWLDNLKQEAQKRGQAQAEVVKGEAEEGTSPNEWTSTNERASSLEETFSRVGPGLENLLMELRRELGMSWERIASVKAYVGNGAASERRYFLEPSSRMLSSGSSWSGRSAGYVWQVGHPNGHRFYLILTMSAKFEPFYIALDEGGRSISMTSGAGAISEPELQNLLTSAFRHIEAKAR